MLDADTYLLAPKMIKRLKKETRAFSPKCFLLAKGQDHYGKKKIKFTFLGDDWSRKYSFLECQIEVMLSI